MDVSFEERTLVNGKRIILPARRLPRAVGIVLIVMGLVVGGIFVNAFLGNFSKLAEEEETIPWVFTLVFTLFTLIPCLIGAGLFLAGIALLAGVSRVVVELRGDAFRVRERMGPASWGWSRPIDAVSGLHLKQQKQVQGRQKQQWPAWEWTLVATGEGIPELAFGRGYGREVLAALAERLAPELGAKVGETVVMDPQATAAAAVTRDPWTGEELPPAEVAARVAEPPPGSRIQHEVADQGVAMRIPPAGPWKGSKGLFFFSLFWNGFVLFFLVVATIAFFKGNIEGDAPPWLVFPFMIPFVAVGVGTMLAALNMGRRRAEFLLTREGLQIKRTGIFGTKVEEVPLADIVQIRRGPSGMSVNDVPVMELQVERREGKTIGLCSQLDDGEIDWMAGVMEHKRRQWLGADRADQG